MTSISRRSFLAIAAASGAAALSNTVSAQEKPSVSEKFKDYPAGAKSAPNTQHCRSRFLTLA